MTKPPLTAEELRQIRERHKASWCGPYRFFANVKTRQIYLATIDRGRQFVMRFRRWGMWDATPIFQDAERRVMLDIKDCTTEPDHNGEVRLIHPDAIALEKSWEDREALLHHIDHLHGLLGRAASIGRVSSDRIPR